MNNLRGAKIIYQESKATQPSHLYLLQKDENYCEVIVTSESGAKRKLNIDVDLSNYYTKNETYSKIEVDSLLEAIEVTKSELDVLISENKLEPNRLYKITGVESWCFSQYLIKTIYLKAVTNNTLESEGVGEFYTPKYNDSDSNLGIWKGELLANGMIDSASYNIGDKVIWGNLFWENISGEIGSNIKHVGDSEDIVLNNYLSETDWQLITPNDDESLYNVNFNIIKYDLINDYIYYREDDLGNKYELSYDILLDTFPEHSIINLFPEFIYNVNSIALFQWGRDNTSNNIVNESIVLNCNYNTLYFKDNIILDKTIIQRNNFLGISFIGNKLKRSYIFSNDLKTYGNILYNDLENSQILSNRYYVEISYNVLNYNSEIVDNNDYGIILNDKYSKITTNSLYNNSKIAQNVFVEEGKEVDGTIKSIYGNELINNCSISFNTIKNGSTIFGHRLEYDSTINGNILDTEANIYNNQLIQNGKIDNNILTGHGRIYGNQLHKQSEITLCKLRISPTTSYASGIHSNRLFRGKIQNVDFGNIVNPEGTNPNDPSFGGNALSECIIENNSIIKDLTFPNNGVVYIQFVRLNGYSEFKNITVNDSIRNVDFVNTIFNETSDYSKLIEGNGLQTAGFTKTYVDGKLLTLSKLDDNYIPLTGTEEGKPMSGFYEMPFGTVFYNKFLNDEKGYFGFTPEGIAYSHVNNDNSPINQLDFNSIIGIKSFFKDFSEIEPDNKLIYAQRQYVDNKLQLKQDILTNPITGTGTVNYIPKSTGSGTIGNSIIYDNGTNIGIGTNAPNSTDRVHVFSSTTKSSIRLQSTHSTSSAEINFQSVGGSGKFELDYSGNVVFRTSQSNMYFDNFSTTGNINFRTGGANTRMTIDKDGNIGVNTPPTEKLDVNGNVLVQGLLKLKPQTSAPTGVEGAIYYNSTTKKHYGFDGTTWNALY